jgi:signal-transduction protein with cAMP-binding, CBS, and nucleotidyltransferase domain
MDAVGIITEKDLVSKVLYKKLDMTETKARDIMSSPLMQMDKRSPIHETALKMSNSNLEHIIVFDEEGMVGIVSARDIAYFASAT